MRCSRIPVLALLACPVLGHAQPIVDSPSPWWLRVQCGEVSMLVDPQTLDSHSLTGPGEHTAAVPSPDGRRVAYIATQPDSIASADLFVADVDPEAPSGRANIRRLTSTQDHPTNPQWLPDGDGLVFLAGENPSLQVWVVGLAEGSRPSRLSDGRHRCYDLSVTAAGDVAYVVHKGSKNKQQFMDLIIQSPSEHALHSASGLRTRTPLKDQHVSGYAISPDGKTLAWSGLGSMFLITLATGDSREVPLGRIHPQLTNHSAHDIGWRPDGKVLAIRCGFLGGIARSFDADEDEPWPRLFADDKVFFVPVDWSPSPAVKTEQEGAFASPIVDDPRAEVSPPAGDESNPWWVRNLSGAIVGLKWITAQEGEDLVKDAGR